MSTGRDLDVPLATIERAFEKATLLRDATPQEPVRPVIGWISADEAFSQLVARTSEAMALQLMARNVALRKLRLRAARIRHEVGEQTREATEVSVPPGWWAQRAYRGLTQDWKRCRIVYWQDRSGDGKPVFISIATGVSVEQADFEAVLSTFPPPDQGAELSSSTGRKGRPPSGWWPELAVELALQIHFDGFPETQAQLIERVQVRTGHRADDSTVKQLVSLLYREKANRDRA